MRDPALDRPTPLDPGFARPSTWHEVASVALGGALGATLRLGLSAAAASLSLHSTAGTAMANLTGAFGLGIFLARFDHPSAHPLFRPFWVIGVFGSYTTFSTLALENRVLAGGRGELVALLHLTGSVALGLAAFALGHAMARKRR
jgi:CrcB protein